MEVIFEVLDIELFMKNISILFKIIVVILKNIFFYTFIDNTIESYHKNFWAV